MVRFKRSFEETVLKPPSLLLLILNFKKKLKGCGIKYYCKIQKTELKARLGFCSTRKPKKSVEISDEFGFSKVYESVNQAANDCGISSSTAIKYALDHGKSSIKRRSDKKISMSKKSVDWRSFILLSI